MNDTTKEMEHYIEHKIKIRLHEHKFQIFEKHMHKMDRKLNLALRIITCTFALCAFTLCAAIKYFHLL